MYHWISYMDPLGYAVLLPFLATTWTWNSGSGSVGLPESRRMHIGAQEQ